MGMGIGHSQDARAERRIPDDLWFRDGNESPEGEERCRGFTDSC